MSKFDLGKYGIKEFHDLVRKKTVVTSLKKGYCKTCFQKLKQRHLILLDPLDNFGLRKRPSKNRKFKTQHDSRLLKIRISLLYYTHDFL